MKKNLIVGLALLGLLATPAFSQMSDADVLYMTHMCNAKKGADLLLAETQKAALIACADPTMTLTVCVGTLQASTEFSSLVETLDLSCVLAKQMKLLNDIGKDRS